MLIHAENQPTFHLCIIVIDSNTNMKLIHLFSGSLGYLQADATAKGSKVVVENGFELYVSGSSSSVQQKGILFIPDVWGWNSGRIRVVADHFAEQGYTSIIPKLMVPPLDGGTDGDGLPPDFTFDKRGAEFGPYMSSITYDDVLKPRLIAAMNHFKSLGIEKISSIGFCWVS